MGCCSSSSPQDLNFDSDVAVRPVTKSNREGAYRVKEAEGSEGNLKARVDENTRTQPVPVRVGAQQDTSADTNKTSDPSSHLVSKNFGSNILSSVYEKDQQRRPGATGSNDEEIKAIMTALDQGGTKEEVKELEHRLSEMSKQITSVRDEKESMAGILHTNILTPIREDVPNSPEPSSESSSEAEDEDEDSSESESDSNLLAPSPPMKNEIDGKYFQVLKNQKKIAALEALTMDLPKVRPYCVA